MTIKRGKLYQFMANQRPLRDMYRGLWAVNAVVAVLLIGGGIMVFAQWLTNLGVVQQRSGLIVAGLIVLVLLMLNALKSSAAAWITSADFETGSDGVYLYLRPGSPTLIRWEDLRGTQVSKMQPPLLFPMKRNSEAFAIHVPTLGFLYRLTGIEYGQGWKPVFVVTSAHENHMKLIEQIQQP
jgi:hypothetical protein